MSALVQKKRQEMGVNVNNGNGSNKSDEQSPLRLFAPRSVAVNKNTSTKDKRSIHFLEIGEEIFEKEIRCQLVDCLKSTIYLREQQDEDANIVSHSPYQKATSSDDTPNSITDELTNVPDPPRVQMLLKETNIRNNSKSTTGTSSCESITTAKRPSDSESGHAKRNGTPTTSNGFKKFNPVSSSSNGNNGRLKTTSSPDIATNHPLGNGLPKPTTSATALNGPRKRLLSERGEYESQYPRIDRSTKIQNNWTGFQLIKGKRCGIGLYNPMNNCFLNSVLQAIVHLPQLARMILESTDGRMCTMNMTVCFHCELRKHIFKAITSQQPFNPFWIQPFLRKIFPQHRNGIQEDAHEMLTLLLSALEPLPPKQTANGLKIHGPTLSTPIEQIFGGNLRNQVICNTCKHVHTNYERIREMNLGLTRNNRTSIIHLIDDFFRDEQLQNFHCSKCKKKQTATRHTFLLTAPSVLIIQLKRFNSFGGKNSTPVTPNMHLILSKYSYKNENIAYKLHGVIEHIGTGLSFGHYICAMRGFMGAQEFYKFDDSERSVINLDYVQKNLQPYILFYTMLNSANQQQRQSLDAAYEPSAPKQQRMGTATSSSSSNGGSDRSGPSSYNGQRLNKTFN